MSGNKVDGDRNIIAGRDVVILDDLSLSNKVRERLVTIDSEINTLLPERILSPTKNNSLESNFQRPG